MRLDGKAESVEGAGIKVVGSATVVIEVEDDEELQEVDEVGGVIVDEVEVEDEGIPAIPRVIPIGPKFEVKTLVKKDQTRLFQTLGMTDLSRLVFLIINPPTTNLPGPRRV